MFHPAEAKHGLKIQLLRFGLLHFCKERLQFMGIETMETAKTFGRALLRYDWLYQGSSNAQFS